MLNSLLVLMTLSSGGDAFAADGRVVVLPWPDSSLSFDDGSMQKKIGKNLGTFELSYYPAEDLYQHGRVVEGRPLAEQKPRPDASDFAELKQFAESLSGIPWDGLEDKEWGVRGLELREMVNGRTWFNDSGANRETLFAAYAQLGRAAENRNDTSPPFFQAVGDHTVNYYWYLAGSMAYEQPGLLSKITGDPDLSSGVAKYRTMINEGKLPLLDLTFQTEDFDASSFGSTYKVIVNGNETPLADSTGALKVAPGRVDLYLKRSDGFGLSDQLLVDSTSSTYRVLKNARDHGADMLQALMLYPQQTTVELDDRFGAHIEVYQKLHPEQDIYVAVPEGGSKGKVIVWKWRKDQHELVLHYHPKLGLIGQ